jgi:hypothetical protein
MVNITTSNHYKENIHQATIMRGTEIEVPNQPDVIPIVKHSKREETDGLKGNKLHEERTHSTEYVHL